MIDHIYALPSLVDTKNLAHKMARCVQPRDVILLKGDLGAGKTALAKFIIMALNPSIHTIPSPTFTLAQTYDTPVCPLWHFDLYRLKHFEEVYELGIEEAFAFGISLIEWPERLGGFRLPSNVLEVDLTIIGPLEQRQAVIKLSESWQQRWTK